MVLGLLKPSYVEHFGGFVYLDFSVNEFSFSNDQLWTVG